MPSDGFVRSKKQGASNSSRSPITITTSIIIIIIIIITIIIVIGFLIGIMVTNLIQIREYWIASDASSTLPDFLRFRRTPVNASPVLQA